MRTVEEELLSRCSVIERNGEAASDGDDALLQLLVCVAAACFAGGNVVEVVDPSNEERQLLYALDDGEVSAVIMDGRKLDEGNLRHRRGSRGRRVG